MMAGGLTDARQSGEQAVMEKALTMLPLFLHKVDILQGIGLLKSSMTLSLSQMLIDESIAAQCRRIAEGITVCDARDCLDDIREVGIGGNFLMQDSTVEAFRSREFLMPPLVHRQPQDQWIAGGRPDMNHAARERALAMLRRESKHPLPDSAIKLIHEIMNEAQRRL